MGPGRDRTRPLDLQSDSHLLPDTLPTALRGPVVHLCTEGYVALVLLNTGIWTTYNVHGLIGLYFLG